MGDVQEGALEMQEVLHKIGGERYHEDLMNLPGQQYLAPETLGGRDDLYFL